MSEIQNRLKTQGLTANHVDDVVRQKEQSIKDAENKYTDLGRATRTSMHRNLNKRIEAKHPDENLQTKRAWVFAKHLSQGLVLTIHGVLQRAQHEHG